MINQSYIMNQKEINFHQTKVLAIYKSVVELDREIMFMKDITIDKSQFLYLVKNFENSCKLP